MKAEAESEKPSVESFNEKEKSDNNVMLEVR